MSRDEAKYYADIVDREKKFIQEKIKTIEAIIETRSKKGFYDAYIEVGDLTATQYKKIRKYFINLGFSMSLFRKDELNGLYSTIDWS